MTKTMRVAYTSPTWPLSERGKDAVRYWALMSPR